MHDLQLPRQLQGMKTTQVGISLTAQGDSMCDNNIVTLPMTMHAPHGNSDVSGQEIMNVDPRAKPNVASITSMESSQVPDGAPLHDVVMQS